MSIAGTAWGRGDAQVFREKVGFLGPILEADIIAEVVVNTDDLGLEPTASHRLTGLHTLTNGVVTAKADTTLSIRDQTELCHIQIFITAGILIDDIDETGRLNIRHTAVHKIGTVRGAGLDLLAHGEEAWALRFQGADEGGSDPFLDLLVQVLDVIGVIIADLVI